MCVLTANVDEEDTEVKDEPLLPVLLVRDSGSDRNENEDHEEVEPVRIT